MILRAIAVMAGLVLLGAMAHVSVVSNGGYGTTQAVMTFAIAGGVATGALVIGRTSSQRRYRQMQPHGRRTVRRSSMCATA